MDIPNPYEHPQHKYYILLPLALMAVSLGLIFFGPGLEPDIDLKGGMLITVQATGGVDAAAVQAAVQAATGQTAHVRTFESPAGAGVEIELALDQSLDQADAKLAQTRQLLEQYEKAQIAFSQGQGSQQAVDELGAQTVASATATAQSVGGRVTKTEPIQATAEAEAVVFDARAAYRQRLTDAVGSAVSADSISVRQVGSTLSAFFVSKTQEVVLLSFLLSGILVFLVFRAFAASLAVIFGAVADIVIVLGAMSLLGITVSLASIAALLMLIGLSLDTDMMLTTRVVKRKEGTPAGRAFDAMKTAALMNATTVVAFGVLAGLSIVLQIPTYYQIGVVATIGGLVDFLATWAGNAPLILHFTEGKA